MGLRSVDGFRTGAARLSVQVGPDGTTTLSGAPAGTDVVNAAWRERAYQYRGCGAARTSTVVFHETIAPQATSLLGGGEQAMRSELRWAKPVFTALKFVAVTFWETIRVKGAIVRIPGGATWTGCHFNALAGGTERKTSNLSPTVMHTFLPFSAFPMDTL